MQVWTKTQRTATGAVLGGVAGNLIGGDTGSTLGGAALGGVIGQPSSSRTSLSLSSSLISLCKPFLSFYLSERFSCLMEAIEKVSPTRIIVFQTTFSN